MVVSRNLLLQAFQSGKLQQAYGRNLRGSERLPTWYMYLYNSCRDEQ